MKDKDILKEILAQDEYTDYHHASGGGFWDFLDPVFHWVKGLFPNFDAPSDGVVSLFTYALIALLLGLLFFAVYWFVKQLVRQDSARVHTYLPVDGMIHPIPIIGGRLRSLMH
jgi:hypothetical protein